MSVITKHEDSSLTIHMPDGERDIELPPPPPRTKVLQLSDAKGELSVPNVGVWRWDNGGPIALTIFTNAEANIVAPASIKPGDVLVVGQDGQFYRVVARKRDEPIMITAFDETTPTAMEPVIMSRKVHMEQAVTTKVHDRETFKQLLAD